MTIITFHPSKPSSTGENKLVSVDSFVLWVIGVVVAQGTHCKQEISLKSYVLS